MAQRIDEKAKQYMQQPDVFADIFNYYIYNGETKLQPHNLRELDTTELTLPYGANGKMYAAQKYRDVLKYAVLMEDGHFAYQLILGIENQTNTHYAMPVKNMIYDALNYGKQVTAIARAHREEERNGNDGKAKRTRAEFLSGLKKSDRILPVVTVVVYLGVDKWDGPMNLHSMFRDCAEEVLQYVTDYKVNLVAPSGMDTKDIARFSSRFWELATLISCAKNKQALEANVVKNQRFEHLDKLTVEIARGVIDSRLKIKENTEGDYNMCKAIDELIADGKAEARAEGRAEGKAEENTVLTREFAAKMLKNNEPISKIEMYTNLTTSKIKEIAAQLGVSVVM